MTLRCDLHLHTSRSDGRYAPQEVVARCVAGGLNLIAITDHDCVWTELECAAEMSSTMRILAGAEMTGVHEGRELHLLCYFAGAPSEAFIELCEQQRVERRERFFAALKTLALKEWLPTTQEQPLAWTRFHLAQLLVASGQVKSIRQAFASYLADELGVVKPMSLSFIELIRRARSAGAVVSWAHPAPKMAVRYVSAFADAGLQGLEVYRPGRSSEQRRVLRKLAKAHDLFVTGGSDWHGFEGAELGLFRVLGFEVSDFLYAMGLQAVGES